jgi:hypothetical protein
VDPIGRRRVRRLLAAAATVVAVLELGGTAYATPQLSWRVTAKPFGLAFLFGGSQRAAETKLTGGPGGRLRYRLDDRSFHGLTNLIGTTKKGATTEYTVATDEPGRTGVVDVAQKGKSVSVEFSLQPATGVVDTFEAFSAGSLEHFLGGGERGGGVVGLEVQLGAVARR